MREGRRTLGKKGTLAVKLRRFQGNRGRLRASIASRQFTPLIMKEVDRQPRVPCPNPDERQAREAQHPQGKKLNQVKQCTNEQCARKCTHDDRTDAAPARAGARPGQRPGTVAGASAPPAPPQEQIKPAGRAAGAAGPTPSRSSRRRRRQQAVQAEAAPQQRQNQGRKKKKFFQKGAAPTGAARQQHLFSSAWPAQREAEGTAGRLSARWTTAIAR